MGRKTPWLVLAVAVLVAAGFWLYRNVRADGLPPPNEVVRRAWTDGRHVALEGRQVTRMPGVEGEIEAEVLTSRDGQLRIEYLTEPLKGVTVWENGERTYRYNPARKRLSVARKRGSDEDAERQEELLLENYETRLAGTGSVAGRPTLVVDLRPKSGRGHWKRIWVDRETWVILASTDFAEGEKVRRSLRLTRVNYLPPGSEPGPERFRPPQDLIERYGTARPGDTSSRFDAEALSDLVGFELREPKWLPKGYTFHGAYQTPCGCNQRHQAARLEYSDGLNTISLFQCRHPRCTSAENCFGSGDPSSQAFQYQRGTESYLAIGDAPPEDLERIVRSAADL
jgi:outer membrane lipoprotein-sorting protein